ncbi:MAG: glycosyltransferase family 4 protein [Candidatus Paceibacterota bacterium]
MAKKRVLIFSLVYYPRFIGGAEVALKEITDRISPEEIEFDMVTLRLDSKLPKFEKVGNINVYRLGFVGNVKETSDSLRWPLHLNKYLLTFLGFFKALSLHKKNHYDATWSMMASYNGFAALFFKWFKPEVPFLLTLQEGDPIEYIKKRVGFFLPVYGAIFKKADFIQTISRYLADIAKDMGAKCVIRIVPNGVDVKKFEFSIEEHQKEDLRKDLGIQDGDKVLITTSRLVVKNAIGDVIKAMEFLPKNIKFLILGEGYQLEDLKKLAADIKVSDRVKFLGFVSHKEMPKYLKISDIFIRPSLSEGFGNSFIEAMAADVPVIATPIGGILDFLIDKETGLFCDIENPKSIANRVSLYLSDDALRNQIIKNGKKMVKDRYDWKQISQEMKEKVFDKILL